MVKDYDSMVIGYIVSLPGDLGFKTLYQAVEGDWKAVTSKYGYSFEHVFETVMLMKYRNQPDHLYLLMELTGIAKSFGHPKLTIEDGMMKVIQHTTQDKDIDLETCNRVTSMFKHMFCKAFFDKNRRWPNSHWLLTGRDVAYYDDNPVYQAWKQKVWTARGVWDQEKDYWREFVDDKELDYDYTTDTSELLKDSTLSPSRQYWTEEYDHCAFKLINGQDKPRNNRFPHSKRVILRYTQDEPMAVYKHLMEAEAGIVHYWRDGIAFLCRKEGELGTTARMFQKQGYEQRLKQTSREYNISNSIFPYFKEQTMSDS